MKLFEYPTLQDKAEFFKDGDIAINVNINAIFDKLHTFQTKGTGFIYRGCSEAKYGMYNSAQRIYMSQDLHLQVPADRISEHYCRFISELINEAEKWNNGVISKLLAKSDINPKNSIALLSYMQHYGLPTPFLDFTYNPFVALFFAIDNIKFSPSDVLIDNYFSLYYSFEESTAFAAWKYVFNKSFESEDITYEKVDNNFMSIIVPNEEMYKIVNSLNIINQEGLFLYNNHPWYPIERTYREYIVNIREEMGDEKYKRHMFLEKICGCFNIHKSLIPAIKDKLKEMGITKDYIYPNVEKFKEQVTELGIKNILTITK